MKIPCRRAIAVRRTRTSAIGVPSDARFIRMALSCAKRASSLNKPMNDQPSLPGFDPPPKPTDSLFFALVPDAAAIARIERLAQALRSEHGLKGKAIDAPRLHVTLHHLGNHVGLPAALLAAASEAAQSIAAAPFPLVLDRAASFPKPRNSPFVLLANVDDGDGDSSVTAFHRTLGEAMKRAGLGAWVQSRFTPHLTLLYDDHRVAEQTIEPIEWTAHEFVLVRSLLGRGTHVPVMRWPLRA